MSKRTLGLYAAMSIIWGVPYLLIKIAVRDFHPATLVFIRTSAGAVVLLPLALVRREITAVLIRWRPLVAYTVAELAVPFLLLSKAEETLSSSLSGLLVAAVPLAGVAVAWLFTRRNDLDARALLGLIVGFGGVVALLGFDVSGADLGAAATVGVVVVGYAIGPAIVAHRLSDVPPIGLAALSLALCAIAYAPIGLLDLPAHPTAGPIAAVLCLGGVCTALAFVLYFALIAEVGPVRATVVTYINPAVAVILGVLVLGERSTIGTVIGFGLILAGSLLATHRSADVSGPTLGRSRRG